MKRIVVLFLLVVMSSLNGMTRVAYDKLFDSITEGRIDECLSYLDQGIDVNMRNDRDGGHYYTLLHVAASEGHIKICRALLDCKASVNYKSKLHETPLHRAAKAGHEEICTLLIDNEADVFAETQDGETILHSAAKGGLVKLCKQLLERGVDINVTKDNYMTPLLCAAVSGHEKLCDFFISADADSYVKNESGETLLQCAALGGLKNLCQLLTEKDIFELKDYNEGVPLLLCAVYGGLIDLCRLVLEKGGDVNESSEGMTALIIAASMGYTDMCRFLLKHGARIDERVESGVTALVGAVKAGQTATFSLLVDEGADLHIEDTSGGTLLHCAAAEGKSDICKLLLQKGLAVDAKAEGGTTPFHCAIRAGSVECCLILLDHGAHSLANAMLMSPEIDTYRREIITPLQLAFKYKHVELIKQIINWATLIGLSRDKIKLIEKKYVVFLLCLKKCKFTLNKPILYMIMGYDKEGLYLLSDYILRNKSFNGCGKTQVREYLQPRMEMLGYIRRTLQENYSQDKDNRRSETLWEYLGEKFSQLWKVLSVQERYPQGGKDLVRFFRCVGEDLIQLCEVLPLSIEKDASSLEEVD